MGQGTEKKFTYQATGVGSVPLTDPRQACELILHHFPDIPFWPQLPRRTFLEHMYTQYAEGLPGAVIDETAKTIHVDTAKALEGLERAFERYLENDLAYFAMSPDRAAGFHAFLDALKTSRPSFVKGGITGPVSFGLTVTDENKRAILYNPDLAEVMTKVLVMKARWQVARLKERCPNVIIFIDEPYLISIGSSYVNINVQDAIARLDEVIGAIKEAGALAGVHCCGNTDWPLLLGRNLDILSFDAYTCAREFSLYGAEVKDYVSRGGTIAWGVVPSSDAIDKESPEALVGRMQAALGMLEAKGIPSHTISSLITPSCGLGSLDPSRAEKIMSITRAVSDALR